MPGIPPSYRSRKLLSFSKEWVGYSDDCGLIGIPVGSLLIAIGVGLPSLGLSGSFITRRSNPANDRWLANGVWAEPYLCSLWLSNADLESHLDAREPEPSHCLESWWALRQSSTEQRAPTRCTIPGLPNERSLVADYGILRGRIIQRCGRLH